MALPVAVVKKAIAVPASSVPAPEVVGSPNPAFGAALPGEEPPPDLIANAAPSLLPRFTRVFVASELPITRKGKEEEHEQAEDEEHACESGDSDNGVLQSLDVPVAAPSFSRPSSRDNAALPVMAAAFDALISDEGPDRQKKKETYYAQLPPPPPPPEPTVTTVRPSSNPAGFEASVRRNT